MRTVRFRVRRYADSNRPHLKFVVNGREDGKRTRRFFVTKAEAETYAQQKCIELENGGRAAAEFPERLRAMAEECVALLAPHNCTIADATKHLLAHIAATKKSCTAAELAGKLIAAKRADGASQRYLSDLKSRLTRFGDDFNGQVVASITTARLNEWLRGLNLSPVSRNNYRRVLAVAFSFAVNEGYAPENVALKTAEAKVVDSSPGILTIGQLTRLLESASPDVTPYIAIGAFAGLRRAELERLDWSDLDFDSDLIEVTAQNSKTARRRHVKMQPNLRAWLLPLRKHNGMVVSDEFRKHFGDARAAAGITEWPDNALRHSFASYHLAHFKNSAALALEMGHTNSDMIFRHYRELVKPREAERFWSIRPAATDKIVAMQGCR